MYDVPSLALLITQLLATSNNQFVKFVVRGVLFGFIVRFGLLAHCVLVINYFIIKH